MSPIWKLILIISILITGREGNEEKSQWKWNIWEDFPVDAHLRIYLFNLTNPIEFENGDELPNFQEIGPYVFKETRWKVGIEHLDNGSKVKFRERKTYEFLNEESIGSEDDLVSIVNIPLLTFGKVLSEVSIIGPGFFKNLVKAGEKLTRINERVGDVFYYGFEAQIYIKVLQALQEKEPIPEQFSEGRFGLFKGRNGTDDGDYIVGTGSVSGIPYGEILNWHNETKLQWWGGETCNSINGGTRGDAFDPRILSKAQLKTFDPDVCRFLQYTYHGKKEWEGMQAWEYALSKNLLEESEANACFCPNPGENSERCFKKGVIDLSVCRNGAPLVLSYPHFLGADDHYIHSIGGMEPNASRHISFMTIQPRSGTVLKDVKRFQLNVHLRPFPGLSYFKNVHDLLLPVFWSEKITTLTKEGASILSEYVKQFPYETEDTDEIGSWNNLESSPIQNVPASSSALTASNTFLIISLHWLSIQCRTTT